MQPPPLQFARPRADIEATMRTHGFRTHILLVVAGVVAVLASFDRPWYARAPAPFTGDASIGEVNGPLYGLFHGLQRWVTATNGRTGWHALDTLGEVIAGLALFSAVAAVACMVPLLQGLVAEPLRYASLALLALVAWKVLDPPGPNNLWELRHGALVGGCGALVAGICAQAVASAPSRRRSVTPAYVAPPAPPAYDASGSAPPPGF
jgi:hypothetical protein